MDEIKIKGDEGNIEIKDGKNVEIRGEENTIKVEGSGKRVKVFGKENKIKIKEGFTLAGNFLKQNKILTWIFVILLIAIIIFGCWIRLENLELLKDGTTGGYIPLALDPFYFLRVSETAIASGGFAHLPAYDAMRNPSLHVGWTTELTPKATVFLYKIISVFNSEATLRYVNVISPVIYFALSLLFFFLLVLKLTKSKVSATISTFLLAIIPSYLYRTMAGFSDHESIGMLGFFAVLFAYVFSLDKIEKRKAGLGELIGFAVLTGFLSAFAVAAWSGGAKFIFMIIPISIFLIWLIKFQKIEKTKDKRFRNYILYYSVWIVASLLFSFVFQYPFSTMIGHMFLAPTSLMTSITLLFILCDYFIIKNQQKISKFIKERKLEKYRVGFSLLAALIIGSIILSFKGFNIFKFVGSIATNLVRGYGGGRIGSTVAENAQPYLNDWIGQIGKIFLWIFYLGMIFVGIEFSKGIRKKKNKITFSIVWILMISGILFSRISASSAFNGDNFISKFVYFGCLLLFAGYFIWLYFNDELKIKNNFAVIFVWMIFMLIAGRSAIRLLFLVTPLICFMVGYFVFKVYEYSKSKDDLTRTIFILVLILAIIGIIFTSVGFAKNVIGQARYQSPSAHYQWQNAMSWVRENTAQDSIFVHWWDYGYWVQTLGERATVTDGGHAKGFWDHLIGRYVLTTTVPETAFSFMKSHNVSYLLIDPTDLGKYSAYSSIGSDDSGQDRLSWISVIPLDASQTSETRNGSINVYPGGTALDEDIIYKEGGSEIFLPAQSAGVAGFILEESQGEIIRVEGVFFYNGKQINLPIRYVYYNGKLVDFGKGVEATIRLIPSLNSQTYQIDAFGAAIYLSPKVMNTLFAQIYLMNDPMNKYSGMELAHEEDDGVISSLKMQGINVGEFIYYQGFRGSIKIWEVNYPENIIEREEFLRPSGEYAEFDNLQFTK